MSNLKIAAALLLVLFAPLASRGQDDPKVKALIDKVLSPNADARFAARAEAPQVGAAAILPLAKLITDPPADIKDAKQRLEISITARAAVERIVHHAARPGADAERKAVTAELGKMLYPDKPVKVKREFLHLIAQVCDNEFVSSVARLLGDPDKNVREAARLALERIPGPAAVAALVQAATSADDERKPDLVYSIGKKGDASTVPFLTGLAGKSKGKVRLAALESLARLAAPEAVPIFAAVVAAPDVPERAAIFNEYLRLADNLEAAKNADAARKIYLEALASAPLDHQRERALLRLTRDGGASATEPVLAGLGDSSERVRRFALTRLRDLTGPDVLAALKKAYDDAKPEVKPALLRALAEKDKASAAGAIAQAAQSSDAELKITALDLDNKLENPELEAVYLKTAESGSPLVKPVALKGYLLVARKRLDSGEKEKALAMYTRALEISGSDEERGASLKGILSIKDPKAIDTVAGLLKDPILGADAARGFVALAAAIGAAGDKNKAEEHLKKIVTGDFPRDIRGDAAGELRKIGRDPQQLILSQGYVVKWWLVGPMENNEGKGLETKYFPEDVIDLEHEQRIEARRFRWQEYKDLTLDGTIDLVPVFRRSDNRIAYAYAEIDVPADRDVLFKMGSDDGIACWLNGQRIHLNNAQRSLKVDDDSVKARLKIGKNKVLLKISNTAGTWAFVFRVTDPDGKPVDFSAAQVK